MRHEPSPSEGERLTKAWTSRVLDRASLDEIERLPMDRVAEELPALVMRLLELAAGDGPGLTAREAARIASLAGMRGRTDPSFGEVARDLAVLESILAGTLAASDPAPPSAPALEALAFAFAEVHAAAGEELLRRRSRTLELLASTDELTGLRNRRHLLEQLARLSEMNERYGHPYAVILFDVVGLKLVNDTHGHAAGDRVLIDVARVTERTVRTVDTVVRLSGDEFCVLAPSQDARAARHLARRLSAAVAGLERPADERIAVSIGVAACPDHGRRSDELLARADAAMYRARADGERVGMAEVP